MQSMGSLILTLVSSGSVSPQCLEAKCCHPGYLILEREDEPVIQEHLRRVPALPLVRMFCSTEQLGALRIYAGISLSDFYANIHKVGPSISLSRDT